MRSITRENFIKEIQSSSWIEYEKEKPRFDLRFLCVVREVEECGAEYYRHRILQFSFGNFILEFDNQKEVTHWMPLPDLP